MELRTDQVRDVMRLAGELRELRGTEQSVPHYLGALVRLFSSSVAIRMNFTLKDDRQGLNCDSIHDVGWATTSDRDRVYSFVTENPIKHDPLIMAAFRRRSGVSIARRADSMTRAEWERLPLFYDVHRPAGVDDTLMGIHWKSPTQGEAIVLKRAFGDEYYSANDRDLLELVHTELGPLVEIQHVVTDARLTGREQEIFDLLVIGASEKAIAARLSISTHTVHHHVKGIYRKLDVGSRAELMARARNPLRLRAAG